MRNFPPLAIENSGAVDNPLASSFTLDCPICNSKIHKEILDTRKYIKWHKDMMINSNSSTILMATTRLQNVENHSNTQRVLNEEFNGLVIQQLHSLEEETWQL